ncbi:DUF421 domain-containing protein [Acinetobacter apis]|uniref:Uncharacterized membrane protein YcaP, DUF421 family n=1 Tax=Acinetobacter apis TaxID=1229165 RepID=A0A217EF49_9GAMM|nr:Uncharacterized membrane protein YcaP, DUF421 family [Acinetobacter apis]
MGFDFYVLLLLKLIVSFTIVITYMSSIGKTQITQYTAVDLIGNFILGAVIGGSIYNDKLTLLEFSLFLTISVLFMWFLNYLSRKVMRFRKLAVGESITIIKNGRFLLDEIEQKKRKIDMLRVLSQLHTMGFHSFQEVHYAEIQPDGQLAAVKDTPVAPSEILIHEGAILNTIIEEQKIDKERFEQYLEKQNIPIDQVFIGEYHDQKLYVTYMDRQEKTFDMRGHNINQS